MLLADLVTTWQGVAATRSRRAKADLLASTLRRLSPAEVTPAVAFMCGELRQRQIGVGWASLRELPSPSPQPTLTIRDVDAVFEEIRRRSGPGSQQERRALVESLFARATQPEQQFLSQLLVGELRQGALAGVMTDAVAVATNIPISEVRRALLLSGDLRAVASTALTQGLPGLNQFKLEIGRPLAPMLAQTAPSLSSALTRITSSLVEEKLDGVRVQVHRDGDQVAVFTRSLDDITARVPEVVTVARTLPAPQIVLDGEAIALRADGRPQPFQVTASRVGSQAEQNVPLSVVFFDVLHVDGADVLDEPLRQRLDVLVHAVPTQWQTQHITVDDDASQAAAHEFLTETLRRGHEGVMVKSLTAAYAAGRRGAGWLKVKPVRTLDLVVLAAEWGHGRRQGWLSNLHLGARDPAGRFGEPGGFVMLGKTFKGMTDEMLRWQTERLKQLAVSTVDDWVVPVRPELVVEVAFDGVQVSPRYPGGVALRFARIKGYRVDKRADDADTIDAVLAFLAR